MGDRVHRRHYQVACRGRARLRIRGSSALLLTLAALGLTGCATSAFHTDLLGVNRRAAEMDPLNPAPLVAAGDVLLEMGSVNEAIVSYNNALIRDGANVPALVGLGKAFLKTGKPALALDPLGKAYALSPDNPKVLLLLGVAKDVSGEHAAAQWWYQSGLAAAPNDPAL